MNLAHQHKIKPMKTWKDAAIKATEDSNLVQQIEMILFEHTNKNTMDIAFKILDWHKEELSRQQKKIEEKIETVFDDFRSSNQKFKNGKRRFGLPTQSITNIKHLHDDILKFLR